jgi:hypothetical protein
MPIPSILSLWSAPRCRSTAFSRMIAERGDFRVVHEPFSQLSDFGEAEVAEHTVRSEDELIDALFQLAGRGPLFFKDTTDFRYPVVLTNHRFLTEVTHTFIIRDPARAIASHYRLNPRLSRDEVGFSRLSEIFDAVAAATGRTPVVVDADELVADPAAVVRAYCLRLDMPFLPEALQWSPDMREDWRKTSRWHADTSTTSGFQAESGEQADEVTPNVVLREYLAYHTPYYERLRAIRLRPVPSAR